MTKLRTLTPMFVLGISLSACVAIHDQPPYVQEDRQGPPPWAPAHGYRAKHHYYYYPGPQVYFDVGRKVYFYPFKGDWRVSAALPVGIHIDAHSYQVLDMDTDRPYIYHSDVVKKYPPGQLKKQNKGKGKKWG
ncbi:MAG: hypothetical protein A4E62_00263 [Syntrophorhabdus sp. PtaU1.Bin002]|nr:MAG: hypothetical protein A4E58_01289 [Syntrophorhabdus sp. PtaB.Bin006]OPY73770.1 MAG: hypothetical protein A4E62_00263 [Syntrophorhabdus sp. PtaU1.Bin002]